VSVRRILRVAGLGGAALAVGVATSGGRGREADDRGFRAVNGAADPRLDRAASAITELGSIWASVGGAAVLAVSGRRRAAARGLAAAGAAWLAGQGLKKVFERGRPYEADAEGTRLLIGPPRASSWPSSHPAVLLAFVGAAGSEAGLRPAVRAALTGLAGAVGASRVVVGVHYPADVLGGLLLGKAVAEAAAGTGR
jgi:membrane-associated phospholipid phosphatase